MPALTFDANRRHFRLTALLLAAVSYIPLLATRPGAVAADTKQYLYLDPGRLLSSAASMWNPDVGMGTVTHQNIGYLLPMGPWFWAVHAIGIPTWVGQRLWMGTLLLAAGMGVRYLCRQLGVTGSGAAVAGLLYMLSPYVIDYLTRSSAILLPWAGLGWMMGLTVVASRRGGWRHPAAFALVIALVGGINATSLLILAAGPLLWLAFAAGATREITWRRAVAVAAKIGGLSFVVSLWWIAGLYIEGTYGFDILSVTETIPTVARTSSAAEVLRGLGYWYFYGQDKVQPWTIPATGYTQSTWLIAVSFAVPAMSLLAAGVTRWRYRAFAIALVAGGLLIAVGTFPFGHPSPVGALLKATTGSSSVGLAARSVDRAVPLLILGLALLCGAALAALSNLVGRWHLATLAATAASAGLIAANLPALWSGSLVTSNLSRPSAIPSYWYQAAGYLNAGGNATRVLGLPGEDFAAYRWGVTQDQVAPALLSRPYVDRQVVPQGEPGSIDLLQALDETIQTQTLDPAAIAPLARLMSAGQILLQSDLQYERYALPLPQVLWQQFDPAPAGLTTPVAFGPSGPTTPIKYPEVDLNQLALPVGAPYPPSLAVFTVPGARPIVRAEAGQPTVVAGSGAGLVEAASAGLLANDPTTFYSGSYAKDPAALARLAASGANLVVTDTNQLAGERWGSLRDNIGDIQQAGVAPFTTDPSDYSIPLFPGSGPASQTVAELSGADSVRATEYGNPLTYAPEEQAVMAVDGDPDTAWASGAFGPGTGQRLQIDLQNPVRADHVTLLQARLPFPTRTITRATLRFDGQDPLTIQLGPESLSGPGQLIPFPARTFNRLDLTVDANTNSGIADKRYDDQSPVGFAEIGIPGVGPVSTTLRMPTDLLTAAGAASLNDPLTLLMSRIRAGDIPRTDPQTAISRRFVLPTGRTFTLAGTARISADDSDSLVDQLVGFNPAAATATSSVSASVVAADSSGRLSGDLSSGARAAIDGDPQTAWIGPLGAQSGTSLDYTLDRPLNFDHLDLQIVADGRHSIPTRITVATESGSRTVDLPNIPPGTGRPQGSVTAAPISFAALSGSHVKITIDAFRAVRSLDYFADFTDRTDTLPVALAEIGLPGATEPEHPATIPSPCRSDLMSIDGRPVDVAVSGSSTSALARDALAVRPCGSSAAGITLGPGSHTVQTSVRLPSGLTVDSLSLSSAAGGGPTDSSVPRVPSSASSLAARSVPAVAVIHQDRTHLTVRLTPTPSNSGEGYWLVLGQSQSSGWRASGPNGTDLGPSQLIDGYANGWFVPAGSVRGPVTIHLTWTAQRVVWVAIAVSSAGLVAVGALMWLAPPARSGETTPSGRRGRHRGPRRFARGGHRGGDRPNLDTDTAPSLSVPWRPSGFRPSWRRALGISAVMGVIAGATSRPIAAVVVAPATLVALRYDRGRPLLALGAPAMAVLVAGYILVQQHLYHYLPTINWPADLDAANGWAWLAVSLLVADAVVVASRAQPSGTRSGPSVATTLPRP